MGETSSPGVSFDAFFVSDNPNPHLVSVARRVYDEVSKHYQGLGEEEKQAFLKHLDSPESSDAFLRVLRQRVEEAAYVLRHSDEVPASVALLMGVDVMKFLPTEIMKVVMDALQNARDLMRGELRKKD